MVFQEIHLHTLGLACQAELVTLFETLERIPMTELNGRCLCGTVNFRITGKPMSTRVCWCKDCQHISANGTVNMLFAADAFTFTGTVSEYTKSADSGNQLTRQFCPTCGTQLFGLSSARPQMRVVRVGNLDNPSLAPPSVNIWTSSAPQWACLDTALENVLRQPVVAAPPPANAGS